MRKLWTILNLVKFGNNSDAANVLDDVDHHGEVGVFVVDHRVRIHLFDLKQKLEEYFKRRRLQKARKFNQFLYVLKNGYFTTEIH